MAVGGAGGKREGKAAELAGKGRISNPMRQKAALGGKRSARQTKEQQNRQKSSSKRHRREGKRAAKQTNERQKQAQKREAAAKHTKE